MQIIERPKWTQNGRPSRDLGAGYCFSRGNINRCGYGCGYAGSEDYCDIGHGTGDSCGYGYSDGNGQS